MAPRTEPPKWTLPGFRIPMECRECGKKWTRHWTSTLRNNPSIMIPCPSCDSVDLKVDEGGEEAR